MNRLRIVAILLAVLSAVLLFFGQWLATFVTDYWWFDAVGYVDVFRVRVGTQLGLFFGAALVATAVLLANARAALSDTEPQPPRLPDGVARLPTATLRGPNPWPVVALAAVAGGSLVGLQASARWQHLLLWHHSVSFGYTEPVHGYDASFYVFTLPLLHDVVGLALTTVFFATVMAGAIYLLRSGVRVRTARVGEQVVVQGVEASPAVRSHLGVVVLALAMVFAARTFLSQYDLLFGQHGLIAGPTYSDLYATLPLLLLHTVVVLFGGGLLALGLHRGRSALMLQGGGAIGVSWALLTFFPAGMQQISVLPNELLRESPQILHHIAATRWAWGLNAVEERSLSGDAELTLDDITANQPTLNNVRLWDHAPLLATFSQVQEIRTYYAFNSVDNDRYRLDGELRQIMLSPRELDLQGLPPRARTWVNQTMTYTHGYGLALGPVNEVTAEGLPRLFVQDLPPKIQYPEVFRIDRPELYYGEDMDQPVLVRTANQEFDYPSGEKNVYSVYQGSGGVQVGGVLGRSLFSMRLETPKLLLSGDVRPDSRVLLFRDIRARAHAVAPFLRFDHDPYVVIVDGRLLWVLDGYTHTSRFPYSQQVSQHVSANYLRNSVKVVIDAYDGSIVLYQVDADDPIAQAWAAVFPGLFRAGEEMPASLWAHMRYPADLFSIQADLFATYHMQEAQIFYNREDEWEVPAIASKRMEPYFTVMKLPGEKTEEYIVMLPFNPRNKPNLSAWMVARMDGKHYGKLRVYRFPKDKMVYGPNMIVARINQDDRISEKLSLWNQKGSQVVLGTLLVIPIEASLLYIQPLYLTADSGSIPELKRVIVGYENQIAMESTLDLALASIFLPAEPSADAEDAEGPAGNDLVPFVPDASWQAQAAQARAYYQAATQAAREGDWARYGEQIEALGQALQGLETTSGAPAQPEAATDP